MWELALKNVKFRKTRSLLTVLGILAAIQLYVVMSSLMDVFEKDIQSQISGMAGRIVVEYKSEGINFPPLDTVIKEDSAVQILRMSGIDLTRSSALLFQTIIPAPGPNMPPSVLAVGVEPGKESAYFGDIDVEGERRLENDHSVILGADAAEHYGVNLGDSITLRDETFTVIGMFAETNWLIDGSFVLPLKTAQDIFVRPALVSAIMITAAKADEARALADQINAGDPKLKASTSAELAKNAEKLLEAQRTFFTMINNTAIIIAILIVNIVMVMSIFERRKEIGTLKAVGASGRKIIGAVLAESLSLSLLGGILALPVSIVLNGLMFEEWVLDPAKWLETVAVSALVGLLAALWPAWSAQRVNPLESLRYE
ncbi:ABC transporter permease [Paenibacillus alkalitolerans]|uniref:ABC transporter permease n=1 Tax=Paenibacillus alkalitolerans TaxID=2799335 RepID=UPI0018F359C8|nr:ABC transporter permease [Paenibacillus alkalitolerans]